MAKKLKITTGKKSVRSNSMEQRTQQFVDNGGLGNRQADAAFVKPVPGTDKLWHTTTDDPNEHLTVEYKNGGKHVTTKHVYRT